MSRQCELTGKRAQVGHKVSHSNIKTKRRFLPNLLNVTLISDALGRSVKLRVSANALKTVDHRGGLDAFFLKAKDDDLSPTRRSSSNDRSARRRRRKRRELRAKLAIAATFFGSVRTGSRLRQHELQQQRALKRSRNCRPK